MKIKPIKQTHGSGCGPASIKMVTNYLGLDVSIKNIEMLCGDWKKDGMDNKKLVEVFGQVGLDTLVIQNAEWEDLLKNNSKDKVVVVSWMLRGYIGHFSVVDKVTMDYVWLAEPESGKIIKLQKMIFMRLWFDYDDLWYPEKSSDINLRFMCVVSNKRGGLLEK